VRRPELGPGCFDPGPGLAVSARDTFAGDFVPRLYRDERARVLAIGESAPS